MKKLLALLICVTVLLSGLPLTASAASEENKDIAYERIVEGMKSCESEIIISDLMLVADEFTEIYTYMYYNEPMLFHLDRVEYGYMPTTGYLTAIYPTYTVPKNEYDEMTAFVDSELDAIIASIPVGLDEYEKALYLHDYCALEFCYDTDLVIRDIYTMLKSRKGVCQGYTLLYDELLSRIGIESSAVIANSINHMWNQIKLGDSWYHVDVTWDDPLSSTGNTDFYGRVWYDDFLESDTDMRASHCTDFEAEYTCSDRTFDSLFWKSLNYPMGFANGKTYYFDVLGIYEFELGKNTSSLVLQNRLDSKTLENGTKLNARTFFGSYDNKLIYGTLESFYSYDPASSKSTLLYTPELSEKYIVGYYTLGSTLCYAADTSFYYGSNTDYYEWSIVSYKIGDINFDGKTDASDYSLLKRAVIGTYTVQSDSLDYADINGDGEIDAFDYVLLKRAVLNTYTI